MWYAISAGTGLAIGIGFLIWALVERSKRSTLEERVAQAARREDGYRAELSIAQARAAADADTLTRRESEVARLAAELRRVRADFVRHLNDEGLRKWIESHLS